jgi:hypothetical protein
MTCGGVMTCGGLMTSVKPDDVPGPHELLEKPMASPEAR